MNEIEKISMNEISIRITELIQKAREHVVKTANTTMVFTYYQIGSIIVEEWQKGELRAEYGSKLLQTISNDLTIKFGKGFSVQNLERMRNFFGLYSNSSKELRNSDVFQKSSNVLRISNDNSNETILLPISWSHYLFLMRIDNELERQFYEIESYVMYVNYYDRFVKDATENPTIGIVLSKVKNQAVVEITLPERNRQIFASKYQTILPTKESLQELLNHYGTDLDFL